MKTTVIAQTSIEARETAKAKLKRKEVHISSVLFVPGRPDLRQWVFSTEVCG
jgi:hypothetical protein